MNAIPILRRHRHPRIHSSQSNLVSESCGTQAKISPDPWHLPGRSGHLRFGGAEVDGLRSRPHSSHPAIVLECIPQEGASMELASPDRSRLLARAARRNPLHRLSAGRAPARSGTAGSSPRRASRWWRPRRRRDGRRSSVSGGRPGPQGVACADGIEAPRGPGTGRGGPRPRPRSGRHLGALGRDHRASSASSRGRSHSVARPSTSTATSPSRRRLRRMRPRRRGGHVAAALADGAARRPGGVFSGGL